MTIIIPKKIENEFLAFLNMAQSFYTDEDLQKMSIGEQDCVRWVEEFLGDESFGRFKTKKQQKEAARDFNSILRGQLYDQISN